MNNIFFEKVRFKNFLSFGNNWQEFVYNDGINLIQGFDEDTNKSNGAGKSSFIELIPFALYGKTFKNINKNDIVNWYNESGCEVNLYFSINNDKYAIVRGIKPNKFKIFKNDEELPRLSNVRDFQAKLEADILGFGFNTFKNLCYYSPNTTISIIEAKKEQKRKFLESLFDLSLYSGMMQETNNKLKDNNDKILLLQNDVTNTNTNISLLQKSISDRVIPDTIKYTSAITLLQKELADTELLLDSICYDETAFSNIIDQKQVLISEQNKILTNKAVKKAELQGLKTAVADAEKKIQSTIKEKGGVEKVISNLELSLSGQDIDDIDTKLDVSITSLNENIKLRENLFADITTLETKLQVLETKLTGQIDILNELNNTDRLKDKVDCPTCKQKVDHDTISSYIDTKSHQIQSVIDRYQDGIDKISCIIKEKKGEIVLYDKSIGELRPHVQLLKHDKKQYNDIVIEIENNKKILDTYLDITTLSEEIEANKAKITEYLDDFKQILGYEDDITLKLTEIGVEYDDILKTKEKNDKLITKNNELTTLIVEKQQQLVDINDVINKIKVEHKKEEDRLVVLQTDLIKKLENISNTSNEIDHLEYLKLSLKDENIKQYAISSILPFLNKQTNYYLRASSFPYTVEIDGWLDVMIKGIGVQNVGYGSLSGGEKKAIDIAIQFAANDISMSQAKLNFNILLLDEILDTSLDTTSQLLVMDIVYKRQTTNNSSIYLISHKEEIKELSFDGNIGIKKHNGFSVIDN